MVVFSNQARSRARPPSRCSRHRVRGGRGGLEPSGHRFVVALSGGAPGAWVPRERLFAAFDDPALRERWLPGTDLSVRTTTPPRLARYDWDGGPSKLVVGIEALEDGRSRVALSHERLAGAAERDRLKPWWRGRLVALKEMLEAEAG